MMMMQKAPWGCSALAKMKKIRLNAFFPGNGITYLGVYCFLCFVEKVLQNFASIVQEIK